MRARRTAGQRRRKKREGVVFKWPADEVMTTLAGLVNGERIAEDSKGNLVVTFQGDPDRGYILRDVATDGFAKLIRLGWLEEVGDLHLRVTSKGRAMFNIWFGQKYPGQRMTGWHCERKEVGT